MLHDKQNVTGIANQSAPEEATLQPARIPSRVLAAFIDFIFLQLLFWMLAGAVYKVEFQFLLSCLLAVAYYGIGNSLVTAGSTLGKKAFGISVRNSKTLDYLSIPQSALRSCFHIVFPVLCLEVPNLFFRKYGVVASPKLLELPGLFVLCYFIWNCSRLFVSSRHRAGHDLLAGSVVMQQDEHHRSVKNEVRPGLKRLQIIASIALGALVWWLSVSHHEYVEQVHRLRYPLEQRFAVSILSLQASDTALYIQLLAHQPQEVKQDAEELAHSFCEALHAHWQLPRALELLRIETIQQDQTSSTPKLAEHRLSAIDCKPLAKEKESVQ